MDRARRADGLSRRLRTEAAEQAASDHPEQRLLAFVHAKFKERALPCETTEAGALVLLTALNLVECIAETAPRDRT